MLLLEFDRGLLRFTLNTPALEVLFQLPPQIGKRNSLFPKETPRRSAGLITFLILCRRILVQPFLVAADHTADLFGTPCPLCMR